MSAQLPIVVRPLGGEGNFKVVNGGEVYRRHPRTRQPEPGTVRRGETASAAEICEWQELGAKVVCW